MTENKPPQITLASNLILISAGLGVINYLLIGSFTAFNELIIAFFTIAFIAVIAFLVRQGFRWVKWVLLVLFLFGVPSVFTVLPTMFKQNIIAGFIFVLQTILQLVALICLFLKFKSPEQQMSKDI